MASDTIQKILRLKDEASRPLLKMAIAAEKAAGSVGDLDKDVAAFEKALASLDDEAKKAADGLDDVADSVDKVGKESKKTKTSQMALAGFMGGMGAAAMNKAIAGAQALAKAYVGLGVSSLQVGAQMESFETRLTVLMGSSAAAKTRLDELFKIGSTTPFELGSLVEAEINLRALGVNAEKTMPLIMDFAGAMGVDLASAAVEVGRAMQFGAGAVETISGRALRAQVQLMSGQDALKMSTDEFREALVQTLTDKDGIFAGGTQKLAATFGGMLSNLADAWFKFQKQVADSGLFLTAKATVQVILERLDEGAAKTQDWARFTSGSLTESFFGVAQLAAYISQAVLSVVLLVDLFSNAMRALFGIWLEVNTAAADLLVWVIKIHQGMLAMVSDAAAGALDAPLRAAEGAARDLRVAMLDNRTAIFDNRVEMLELLDRINDLSGVGDVFDDIRTRAAELEKALQMEARIKVNQADLNNLREQLGMGLVETGDIVMPTAPVVPQGTGKSKRATQLDALAKQVESLTKKAFPTTQIEQATKLLQDLEAARDNARRSRRAAYDDLIAQAKTARRELELVDFQKTSEDIRKSLEDMEKSLSDVGPGLAAAGAGMIEEMDAQMQEAMQKASDRFNTAAGALTDIGGAMPAIGQALGGTMGGLAGGAVSTVSALGQEAGGLNEQIAADLKAARKDRRELLAKAAAGEGVGGQLAANKELIATLEGQQDEGGLATMVRSNVEGFIEGIKVLIKEFPSIITDVLPDLIGTLIPELIIALVEASPYIAKAFLVDLPRALFEGFVAAFDMLWKTIRDFFKQLFLELIPGKQKGERGGKGILETAGGFLKDVFHGVTMGAFESKQTGGFINRTGLQLLHAGEYVQPTSGAVPQSARGRMGASGGGVNITINTNVVDPNSIDQLGRMLQRHFGQMGRSTLPIFGGV